MANSRTTLQGLQDEAMKVFRAGDNSVVTRQNLDAILVRAFDAGVKARREQDTEVIRAQLAREVDPRTFEGPRRSVTTHYVVSTDPDRIEDDGDTPTHYQSSAEAGDGIVNGYHGEAGTRYVLKAELSVVATYDRAWSLVREDTPALIQKLSRTKDA